MTAVVTGYRPAKLIGLGCLLVTAIGWGLNWPATKFLLEECPPLTARGVSGIVASLALAGLATSRGETLTVPHHLRWRLIWAALLNVSAWMGLTTLSLLWLNAGEAATLAYTMPVWTALLAWPILGEQLVPRQDCCPRAWHLRHCGTGRWELASTLTWPNCPGVVIVLTAAMLFALGTVLSKRWRIEMSPIAATAWQVGIGAYRCLARAPSWSIRISWTWPGSAGQPCPILRSFRLGSAT